MSSAKLSRAVLAAVTLLCTACGDKPRSPQAQALLDVKHYITDELAALHSAVTGLQGAAPEGVWSRQSHPAAVQQMQRHWRAARAAYEHVEGAIAVLFTNLDLSTDGRYDQLLEEGEHDCPNNAYGDCNLFNGVGVTGMHAIERILWSDKISDATRTFEESLPGFRPATFPTTHDEAAGFKHQLVQRLVDDVATMQEEFEPLALGLADAYRGVIGSMAEQFEKVNFAGSGHDESRYAGHTMADMRANLDGGERIYSAFRPWLRGKDSGPEVDQAITARFAVLRAAYARYPGTEVPAIPAGWFGTSTKPEHVKSDFHTLYTLVLRESDPNVPQSLVSLMRQGAALLEFPDNGKQ